MKNLPLSLCALAVASMLSSCVYDDYPHGYTSVTTYNRPLHVVDRAPYYSSPSYGSTYYPYGPSYTYRTSGGGYAYNRYLSPVGTRTYVSGYPVHPHMSVGGYGYIPPTPRPDPWPLR